MAKGNVNQFLKNPFLQQPQVNIPGIKTKKYQLATKTYIRISMDNLLRTTWYWGFIPVALIILNLVLNLTGWYENWWIYIFPPLLVAGYVLFWAIQFTGVTQLEQNKAMFQKMSYEINGQQILMKLNAKEGMQIKWEMVKSIKKTKDAYLFILSKAQFLHLPFNIFNNENDIRFLENLLKRKNLIS
ncbi:MAG: YcxB family protein [Verrucomicrobia bacterium]|nr:YcxB family protein [Cytophagales bacterium]